MKKRGITPLLATVLLIVFVVIIVTIAFFWTKKIQEGVVEKNAELSKKQLECNAVQIDVASNAGQINVINKGSVKINLIIRETFGGNVRKSDIYDNIESGGSYKLIKGDNECSEKTAPSFDGTLCKQTSQVEIIPAVRPEGRGAPLVPCSDATKTVRV